MLAAGGIVLQPGATPKIAVVRLRKRSEWVLPKGKLDAGETARAAAIREVLEETGHAVAVHEFIGTLAYHSGSAIKVVHFWRMIAEAVPTRKLMKDVTAVDWLSLEAALERLSREHERAFLAEVGPQALQALLGSSIAAELPSRTHETIPTTDAPAAAQPRPTLWARLRALLRQR